MMPIPAARRIARWFATLCLFAAASATLAHAADDWKLDSDTFEGLRARHLGPGVMSGRIACIDGVSGERNTLWVGTAGGGVWRSRDNGTTWRSVFDAVARHCDNPRLILELNDKGKLVQAQRYLEDLGVAY